MTISTKYGVARSNSGGRATNNGGRITKTSAGEGQNFRNRKIIHLETVALPLRESTYHYNAINQARITPSGLHRYHPWSILLEAIHTSVFNPYRGGHGPAAEYRTLWTLSVDLKL